ncbi:MAG TPA: copper resistance protein B [Gammaproteobacteria bacterium]|nr:copper resistance protein B [Gammaproteobacteria bacterium]
MRKHLMVAAIAAALAQPAFAGMGDDPTLVKVMIDQLETRSGDGPDPAVLESDVWIGKDLNKLWLKFDAERVDGETEQADIEARYSRAVAPFWDFQVGLRRDLKPSDETRDWLALGFRGLAPYFFDIDAALYVGDNGRTQLNFDTEYEILFTQRLILTPELQFNLNGKSDPVLGQGSGLSNMELGLRLRYEIRREFAPYVGVNWDSRFGETADFAKAAGQDSSETRIVAGIRAWF